MSPLPVRPDGVCSQGPTFRRLSTARRRKTGPAHHQASVTVSASTDRHFSRGKVATAAKTIVPHRRCGAGSFGRSLTTLGEGPGTCLRACQFRTRRPHGRMRRATVTRIRPRGRAGRRWGGSGLLAVTRSAATPGNPTRPGPGQDQTRSASRWRGLRPPAAARARSRFEPRMPGGPPGRVAGPGQLRPAANGPAVSLRFWPQPDAAACRVEDELRIDAGAGFGNAERQPLADELQRPGGRQRPRPPPGEERVRSEGDHLTRSLRPDSGPATGDPFVQRGVAPA